MTRNENRTTTLKGILANPETMSFEEFEVVTSYTQAKPNSPKVINMAREALGVADNVMVSVNEVINEPLHKVVYDAQLIYNAAINTYDDEETANENCADGQTVVPFTMYEYTAQVWMFANDNYSTVEYVDVSPLKFGIVDTREFIRMGCEDFYEAEMVGIHNAKRTELKHYAVVLTEELESCEKKQL